MERSASCKQILEQSKSYFSSNSGVKNPVNSHHSRFHRKTVLSVKSLFFFIVLITFLYIFLYFYPQKGGAIGAPLSLEKFPPPLQNASTGALKVYVTLCILFLYRIPLYVLVTNMRSFKNFITCYMKVFYLTSCAITSY